MTKQELEKQKNQAYKERDMLVCALSKIYPAHLSRHPRSDKLWENDWRWIVCIHIPVIRRIDNYIFSEEKQVTWHIHDSEKDMFSHLEREKNHWDGHDTDEKYYRLERLWIDEPKKKWYEFWK